MPDIEQEIARLKTRARAELLFDVAEHQYREPNPWSGACAQLATAEAQAEAARNDADAVRFHDAFVRVRTIGDEEAAARDAVAEIAVRVNAVNADLWRMQKHALLFSRWAQWLGSTEGKVWSAHRLAIEPAARGAYDERAAPFSPEQRAVIFEHDDLVRKRQDILNEQSHAESAVVGILRDRQRILAEFPALADIT